MSACCGAKKFRDYLTIAENFVKDHWSELTRCQPGGGLDEDRGWMAYYLASTEYNGNGYKSHLEDFKTQLDGTADPPKTCSGILNFITYLRSLTTSPSYAAQVMSRYRTAVSSSVCDSDCPG